MAVSSGTPNCLRAFFMVSMNSMSSRSMFFNASHHPSIVELRFFDFPLPSSFVVDSFFDIYDQTSGITQSGWDVAWILVNRFQTTCI